MKPPSLFSSENPQTFIKILTLSLFSLSLFFAFKHLSSDSSFTQHLSFSLYSASTAVTPSPAPNSTTTLLSPPLKNAVERTGIVDEHGLMTVDFVIGDYDSSLIETLVINGSELGTLKDEGLRVGVKKNKKIDKYEVCDEGFKEYVPCLDNAEAISRLNSTEMGEKYERHCPESGKGLDCLVPRPKGYKLPIPWPRSRDEVWFDNVPHTHLVEDKGGQNWISRKDDKLIFPRGGTQFIHGADQYLDHISKMVPDIAFGQHVQVALDVGCGVASFGAYLLQRNVTTMSIAPKDGHENQIQFALERGVPAMIAAFATRRLLYPSQAFDLVHCSRCRISWTSNDGILLMEVNRILRAGGYFVWAAQPVYKHEANLQEQWREMEDLTGRICWELVKKGGYVAVWRKPLNNSCYLARDPGVQPPICDAKDDPDNVWYVGLKACITQLPENGYGANVTAWPGRLHAPPDRLQSIQMDAFISRKDIYKAESHYWNEIVRGYVNAFHWKELSLRNVMDMRARYGGFAAALHDFGIDSWVMNVVPVSESNTLPVIYDRGLIGVIHDWFSNFSWEELQDCQEDIIEKLRETGIFYYRLCEPFDTYPRTYDLLNAAGLFSVEQKRCNMSTIMLEMDRILRPGGRVYIRDATSIIDELEEIAKAMGWVSLVFDNGEGPYASSKLMTSEKRL